MSGTAVVIVSTTLAARVGAQAGSDSARARPRSATKGLLALLLALLACVGATAQDRPGAWTALQEKLEDPRLSIEDRVRSLTRFVAEHGASEEGARSTEVLTARSMLGTLRLSSLDAERAAVEFEIVVDRAERSAVDLRGRALYGAAQAAELRGADDRARELYRRLVRDLAGTRYADFARVELHRLDQEVAERPRPGRPAPDFGPALDRTGTARRLADLAGAPALLLFLDPNDEKGTQRVAALVRTARDAGLADAAMIVFSTAGTDDPALGRLARKPVFRMPIVPAPEGFLSSAFLLYEIRAVPSSVLVGRDGTLLGRDLPPRRLREVLDTLRR